MTTPKTQLLTQGVLVMTDNMVVGSKIVDKHTKLGTSLSAKDMADLPVLMTKPLSIWLDKQSGQLIYWLKNKDGQLIKVVLSMFEGQIISRTLFTSTEEAYKAFAGYPRNIRLD